MQLTEITSKQEGLIKSLYGVDRVFKDDKGYLFDENGNSINLVFDKQLQYAKEIAQRLKLLH